MRKQRSQVKMMKALQNSILVLVSGFLILFFFTDGLSAFTSEGARRLAVEKNPIALPKVELTSSDGSRIFLQDFDNKIVLVDFIFTSCRTVCPMVTQNFKELSDKINRAAIKDRVLLVTVSFDPDRDTPDVLNAYSSALGIDSRRWKFVTVNNKQQLDVLLSAFGVVVIPASDGQYEHNSAIHLVDQAGKLAKIYDYEATDLIFQDLNERIHES